jgi:Ca2+-binding EF-hand superfamily protein
MSFLNKSVEDMQACFALFDSGNGTVSADNLAEAVRTLGFTPTKEELAELGKGPFDFEAFQGACSKMVC